MKNLRPFEIALIGIFGVFAIGGLIFVTLFKSENNEFTSVYGDSVMVWGTLDQAVFSRVIEDERTKDKAFGVVRYEQKDPRTFMGDILSAVAEGNSPDLIIVPHSALVSFRAKLRPLTYESFSERSFRDRYIEGASIFMLRDGVYGIPLVVDPLMMFWNRDVLSSSGLAQPPTTWEALVNETTPAITRSDAQLQISQSAVSFGEYSNITHAKEIISMLLLQSGSPLVEETEFGYSIELDKKLAANALPSSTAVFSFYSQFVNPASASYTWNRSLPQDTTQFLAGKLGLYFAPGSERIKLQRENPNIDFDVAPVPQGTGATIFRDHGDFYALAVPRASQNPNGAYGVAFKLGSEENVAKIAKELHMAPVYRSLIQKGSTDTFESIIYSAALTARGWLDPNPARTGAVFKELVENISSGRARTESAISDATHKLEALFK